MPNKQDPIKFSFEVSLEDAKRLIHVWWPSDLAWISDEIARTVAELEGTEYRPVPRYPPRPSRVNKAYG